MHTVKHFSLGRFTFHFSFFLFSHYNRSRVFFNLTEGDWDTTTFLSSLHLATGLRGLFDLSFGAGIKRSAPLLPAAPKTEEELRAFEEQKLTALR